MKDYISGGSVAPPSMTSAKFHTAIVEASSNRYLTDMYASRWTKTQLPVHPHLRVHGFRLRRDDLMLCNQHASVMHAIKMGFPELARQAMDDHIDFARKLP